MPFPTALHSGIISLMESLSKYSAIIFQVQSTLIVLLMLVGIHYRKIRSKHVKIMSTVIAWDILLILQIELSRSAIVKASKAASNEMLLNIHVLIAVSTVIAYGLMVQTGRKILKGENALLPRHKLTAIITVILRLLTYATSFFIVS